MLGGWIVHVELELEEPLDRCEAEDVADAVVNELGCAGTSASARGEVVAATTRVGPSDGDYVGPADALAVALERVLEVVAEHVLVRRVRTATVTADDVSVPCLKAER